MIEEDKRYLRESEIDNAIPYLDELNNRLEVLSSNINDHEKKKLAFLKFHSKKEVVISEVNISKKYLKTHNFKKDGYEFRIKLEAISTKDNPLEVCYYEFFVNIKYAYAKIIRRKQFYKKFTDEKKAKQHYKDMEGGLVK